MPSTLESPPKTRQTKPGQPSLTADPARSAIPLKWENVAFLAVVHLVAAYAVVYMATVSFSWWTVGLGALWYLLCGLSITGGYHRCFAHASYKAHPALRAFYLLFGAASFQNSGLNWAADHRAHHSDTEGPLDPYSIERGFWWAHVGWVLHEAVPDRTRVRDLEAQRLMRFQDRHWMVLGIVVGMLVPMALGFIWGDPIGALLVAGFLRLALQFHATFAVNSVAHLFGSRPYSLGETARDNMFTAMLTLGEGYHNYHHRFPFDYRCGRHWYDFDPTKWWLMGLAACGLVRNRKAAPMKIIDEARSKVLRMRAAAGGGDATTG